MITKVSKLEKVGKFSSVIQEKDFQRGEGHNCNIIFGFNGSGKTTLSNAISFFADNSFISEDEKAIIFDDIKNDDTAAVELNLESSSTIKYNPANHPHSKTIYVFNSNFISTHVFDGTKGRLRKFSNASGEIKNEAIEEANTKIRDLEAESKRLKDDIQREDEKVKTISSTNSSNFAKILTDKNKRLTVPNLAKEVLPPETLETLQQKLSNLAVDYDLSKKQSELSIDLAQLSSIMFKTCDLDLIKIKTALNKNIPQLSKDILEAKIKEVKDLFADEAYKQSTEKWFRFGKSILDNAKEHVMTKCPICDSDISGKLDTLLQNFNGYFDKGYEDFIAELRGYGEIIQNAIDVIEKDKTNAIQFGIIFGKYKVMLPDNEFAAFDFDSFKKELVVVKTNIDKKLADIQLCFDISQTITDALGAANFILTGYVDLNKTIVTTLGAKKLDTGAIEDQIRQTYKSITVLEFDKSEKDGALAKYKINQAKIDEIFTTDNKNDKGILFYQEKRREELKKIKAESKSISKFLKIMGIEHFSVDINDDALDENIIIRYKLLDTDKNKLRNCLSDGEKTALAFAYFLSKFQNERDTEEKVKESVVVIDDPISSLDENRIYSTAYLIRDNFKLVKQLIVLSHNFLFLKFFNTAYEKNTNCLFIQGNKIIELPEELRNFESPYFYMLKILIEYTETIATPNPEYNNAKKYLPNYIRRILETFLSFKFAKVAIHGKRSPGLPNFNDNIDGADFDDTVKQDLKQKIVDIIKITDAHSHGSAQLTEENFYISEEELKKVSENAVAVIDAMDSIHKANIIKPSEEKPVARLRKNQTQAKGIDFNPSNIKLC